MIKFLKFFAVLFSLCTLALGLLVLLTDPNDFRGDIEDAFAAATGRTLVIDGDLRLALWPRPMLEIGAMSLPAMPGSAGSPRAEIDLLRVYPRLAPMVLGRLDLGLIRAEGVRIAFPPDAEGRTTGKTTGKPVRLPRRGALAAMAAPDSAPAPVLAAAFDGTGERTAPRTQVASADRPPAILPVPPDPPAEAADPGSRSIPRVTIGAVEIIDGALTWDVPGSGRRLAFDDLAIATGPIALPAGPIALPAPVAWRLEGSLRDGGDSVPSRLHAEGRLAFDPGMGRVRIAPLRLDLEGFRLREGPTADLLLRTALDLDLEAGRLESEETVLDVEARGGGLPEGGVEARVAARLELDLGSKGGSKGGSAGGSKSGPERLEIADLSIRSGTLSARGRAVGQGLRTNPRFTGTLALDTLDLRAWLAQRGLALTPTADLETFRRVALQTGVRFEKGRLDLEDLALDIDQTRLAGTLAVIGNPPAYRFDLAADRLDLDRYLPARNGLGAHAKDSQDAPAPAPVQVYAPAPDPGSDTRPASQSASQSASRPEKGLARAPIAAPAAAREATAEATDLGPASTPVEGPPRPVAADMGRVRASVAREDDAPTPLGPALARLPAAAQPFAELDIEGRLHLEELILARLHFGATALWMRGEKGRLDVDNRVQAFYQGTLAGRIAVDLRTGEPELRLVQRAEEVETAALLADLEVGDRLTGRATITTDLAATGRDPDALRHNLAGDLAIHIDRGALQDFNLERLVLGAQARLQGKNPPADLPTATEFKDLGATARIDRGVLTNRDLAAFTDHVHIRGSGRIDIARRQFDYRFEPMFVDPPRGRGIKELEGIPIPILLTGPFDQPHWDVDLRSAIAQVAERELSDKAETLLNELSERTGAEGLGLGLGLRRLFER